MLHKPMVSIVIPMYNEGRGLDPLFTELRRLIKQCSEFAFHLDCINDGSTDDTLALLMLWQKELPQIRIINLSRNFGKEAALTAGIDNTLGEAVIMLDADLQDPPSLIPQMLKLWQDGAKVVLAKRQSRSEEGVMKPFLAKLFYKFINLLSSLAIPENVGDFRLLDRCVVAVIKQLPERNRFMKGLMIWPGFATITIPFTRPKRRDGASKLSFFKLLRLACDGICAFSSVPLKMWTYVGFCTASCSFVYGVYLIACTILADARIPGYPSLMVAVLFTSGVQMLSVGVVGEYVARIYEEVKQRPIYIIERIYQL